MFRFADIAQMVEQFIRNDQVIGSSPIIGYHIIDLQKPKHGHSVYTTRLDRRISIIYTL